MPVKGWLIFFKKYQWGPHTICLGQYVSFVLSRRWTNHAGPCDGTNTCTIYQQSSKFKLLIIVQKLCKSGWCPFLGHFAGLTLVTLYFIIEWWLACETKVQLSVKVKKSWEGFRATFNFWKQINCFEPPWGIFYFKISDKHFPVTYMGVLP